MLRLGNKLWLKLQSTMLKERALKDRGETKDSKVTASKVATEHKEGCTSTKGFDEHLFRFGMKQRIFEIGNLKIGGQPGETLTVLIGSIFYHRQKIVLDENTGRIDRINAQELIRLQEEFSEKTGNPSMLDVVGSTREAMENYIDFVAEVTEMPILVDSPSVEVRIAGLNP